MNCSCRLVGAGNWSIDLFYLRIYPICYMFCGLSAFKVFLRSESWNGVRILGINVKASGCFLLVNAAISVLVIIGYTCQIRANMIHECSSMNSRSSQARSHCFG